MKIQIVVYESTSRGKNLMHQQRVYSLNLLALPPNASVHLWIFHVERSRDNEDVAPLIKTAIAIKSWSREQYKRIYHAPR